METLLILRRGSRSQLRKVLILRFSAEDGYRMYKVLKCTC